MDWRLARCLETLRKQLNEASPERNKSEDGTIGDERHQSRTSDHNPWVDGNVVTAFDITHDPSHRIDCTLIAEQLRASKDRRIKYIIWNGQIANYQSLQGKPAFAWRPYRGPDAHKRHLHLSVRPNSTLYDDATQWQIANALPQAPTVSFTKLKQIAAAPAPAPAQKAKR